MDKEEMIKFWKSSASRSGSRNFSKDSSALRDRTSFPQFRLMSLKKLIGSYDKYLWTKKSPLSDSPWRRAALSDALVSADNCLF